LDRGTILSSKDATGTVAIHRESSEPTKQPEHEGGTLIMVKLRGVCLTGELSKNRQLSGEQPTLATLKVMQ